MKISLSLCVLFGVAWDLSSAAAFEGRTTLDEAPQPEAVRASGDSGQANNMTVAFVPLISIIANLLPRFFSRYATVPPSSVQQARSIYMRNQEAMECQKPEHIGTKLPDSLSLSHYYQCHLSTQCFKVNQESCFQLKRYPCKRPKIFNLEKQNCFWPHFPN